MTSLATDLNSLLGVQEANPIKGVSKDEGNVTKFPEATERLQNVILSLALRGDSIEEIAKVVEKPVDKVEMLLRTEWAAQEFEKRLKETPDAKDTLRNLVRIHAYSAVQTIAEISKNAVDQRVKLSACRTLLEYSLPPAKVLDTAPRKAEGSEQDEYQKLKQEEERLTKQLQQPL